MGTDGSIFDFRKVARRAGALDHLIFLFHHLFADFAILTLPVVACAYGFGSMRSLSPIRRSFVHQNPDTLPNLPCRCFIF